MCLVHLIVGYILIRQRFVHSIRLSTWKCRQFWLYDKVKPFFSCQRKCKLHCQVVLRQCLFLLLFGFICVIQYCIRSSRQFLLECLFQHFITSLQCTYRFELTLSDTQNILPVKFCTFATLTCSSLISNPLQSLQMLKYDFIHASHFNFGM